MLRHLQHSQKRRSARQGFVPPINFTSDNAIRRPGPVRSYAVPNMKAEKASQTVELLNPDSAHSIARTGVLKPGLDNSAVPNKVQGAKAATTVTPISPIAEPGKA